MSKIDKAVATDQSKIGTEVGVSDWIEVDQAMINQFAAVTHDEQWIHVDPERAAAQTPFGGSIAHGFLTLSLASRFAYDCLPVHEGQVMGINYGFNKIRFLSPVKAGSRLRGRFMLRDVKKRSERELQRETLLTIEIEGAENPALVAEWLSLSIFE